MLTDNWKNMLTGYIDTLLTSAFHPIDRVAKPRSAMHPGLFDTKFQSGSLSCGVGLHQLSMLSGGQIQRDFSGFKISMFDPNIHALKQTFHLRFG
jgi:hypothetical protein